MARKPSHQVARPGGNVTGFTSYEYSMSGKWLELLKEIAPGVKRVAVLRDPTVSAGIGQFGAIQTAAPSFGVELSPINVHDAAEIERDITEFERPGKGGLIVTTSASVLAHRNLIIALAARNKLPAIYYARLRRPGLLWARLPRPVSPRRQLRRSHSQGRKAR